MTTIHVTTPDLTASADPGPYARGLALLSQLRALEADEAPGETPAQSLERRFELIWATYGERVTRPDAPRCSLSTHVLPATGRQR